MAGTYTNLLYHIVFSTKNRIPLISSALEEQLYSYVGGIIRAEGGTLLQIGGMPDHVHLLLKYKPTFAVSEILNHIKANSSKWANEKAKSRSFAWQDGYSAFSVSESQVASVRSYIQNQASHHERISFRDELKALLERNGIPFEDRHLDG
jgi:REP element-mobilizing transposase RayT